MPGNNNVQLHKNKWNRKRTYEKNPNERNGNACIPKAIKDMASNLERRWLDLVQKVKASESVATTSGSNPNQSSGTEGGSLQMFDFTSDSN